MDARQSNDLEVSFVTRLTGKEPSQTPPSDDERYKTFSGRLRKLCAIGTDTSVESLARREQSILSQYLFEGSTTLRCAICGNDYGIGALVTAHKKKRSLCNERERLDPHIVMPLCVFGCDYLYERDLINIVDGQVVDNSKKVVGAGEKAFIEKVDGRRLPKEWLRGDPSYFVRG